MGTLGWRLRLAGAAAMVGGAAVCLCPAADLGQVPQYHVLEVALKGPQQGPTDTPARDVELWVTFRHESGRAELRVAGFWDGDGKGGARGEVFKVRFCPTGPGRWRIARTESNRPELAGQREGDELECTASKHPGFWIADGRWYRRSDGSHPYVVGNTHYSFLSGQDDKGPSGSDPAADIRANAQHFGKLRFSVGACRYPDPKCKPFLDDRGEASDDGRFSLRPNPAWFASRLDAAVRAGFECDLACDLILCGPDTAAIRSTLKGDASPYLRYAAARYGSYPNVWFCLCNEWSIKNPSYKPEEIVRAGQVLRKHLPYPTPVSVHGNTGNWNEALNGDWHDHVIIQWKLKKLDASADATARNHQTGGRKPLVNDENAYEGDGDKFTEGDVIEGCFGTFLGGGYPTTGEKYASKKGQYFWGGFDAGKHKAADNLGALGRYVDAHIAFWRLAPADPAGSIFSGLDKSARLMAEEGREYVLGTNAAAKGLCAKLPDGTWRIVRLDLMAARQTALAEAASGEFTFDVPPSRAVLTHFRRTDGPR